MATIKVKFRPSAVAGKEGIIYYQVTRKREACQIMTGYRLRDDEWDEGRASAVVPSSGGREAYILAVNERVSRDLRCLGGIIEELGGGRIDYSASDVAMKYEALTYERCFFRFMEEVIVKLKTLNRQRTAENYEAALKSFKRFRSLIDVSMDEITADMMMEYEAYLKVSDIAMNTISFYMRILRAVYNRAVERRLTEQRKPFRHVYTGIDKTVKRAISLKAIKRIKELDLSAKPSLDFARDIFMFSFYTRGMSFVDIAYLRKRDLQNGVLSYRRRKTGQQLFIKWEKCMQSIVDKYPANETNFLLPIIKTSANEARQYRNALHLVNNKLKEVSAMAGLHANLTMYVSRHSWASIAKSKNVPLSVISEGMGHDSETTTQIYLASLDSSLIDKANEMILKNL